MSEQPDIVERLRDIGDYPGDWLEWAGEAQRRMDEAADAIDERDAEIDRLRAENSQQRSQLRAMIQLHLGNLEGRR